MSKPKESKNVEFYLGQIRQLQKENKQLNRIIKSLKKQQHLYHDNKLDDIDDVESEILLPPKTKRCPDCCKSNLIEFELIGRKFERCDLCGFRKKISG